MNKLTTIGLDVAKHTFQVVGCDRHGHEVSRKVLRRGQVLAYFANLPACAVGIEACASAHFWARELHKLGHEVRLIPPQHVKAYVRGNKTDYHDARAIAEAVRRPDRRFVSVKTVEQQDMQALYRLRAARVQEHTTLCNQVRGLLAEYGIVLAQGVGTGRAFRRGRDVSAALGLVPKQHSSGGGGRRCCWGSASAAIGMSAVCWCMVRRAAHRGERLSRWITRLQATRGTNKATVALANKLARIGWAVIRTETQYRAA